ncbi:unnamed protein product, partial [marine sediment metagenome]
MHYNGKRVNEGTNLMKKVSVIMPAYDEEFYISVNIQKTVDVLN